MCAKKQAQPLAKIGLALTNDERTLLVNGPHLAPTRIRNKLRSTAPSDSSTFSMDDLHALNLHLSAKADSIDDKGLQRSLDRILDKVEAAIESHSAESRPADSNQMADLLLQAAAKIPRRKPTSPRRTLPPKTEDFFQLKIELCGISPPIWRRVQTPDCTLGDLHLIIQVVMGWENCHLHQFKIDKVFYGIPEEDEYLFGPTIEDECLTRLSQIIPPRKRKLVFTYEYDFGDSWLHEVIFEGRIAPEPGVDYPRCIDGKRAGPPEDSGGPWGYGDMLEAWADPKQRKSDERLEWLGPKFDPERFKLDQVNKSLARLAKSQH